MDQGFKILNIGGNGRDNDSDLLRELEEGGIIISECVNDLGGIKYIISYDKKMRLKKEDEILEKRIQVHMDEIENGFYVDNFSKEIEHFKTGVDKLSDFMGMGFYKKGSIYYKYDHNRKIIMTSRENVYKDISYYLGSYDEIGKYNWNTSRTAPKILKFTDDEFESFINGEKSL